MNTLEFEVHNQTLIRVDSQEVINKNKNVYKCRFTFEEDSDWINLNKFVIFTDGWDNSITQHLGNNSNILSCLIPDKMLKGSYFKISVYAGDLITTNTISVALIQSGYQRQGYHCPSNHNHCHHDGRKDIFVEIFDRLDNSIDSIVYDKNTLHLFNQDRMLESIYLPFLESHEIEELVDDLTQNFILATGENNGLMSKEDKRKLDNIEDGANLIIVDSELDNESENPVQNKVITDKINNIITNYDNDNDDINNRLDTIDDDINQIAASLNNKEDVYDYVERLDNLIVALIQKNE